MTHTVLADKDYEKKSKAPRDLETRVIRTSIILNKYKEDHRSERQNLCSCEKKS